jgi:hypothetical protein
MIVYHFISSEFALKALRDRRLKITRINELNDPLQFCAADFCNSDTQTKLETFKNQANERYGVISFCENYHDPVLWIHYEIPSAGLAPFQLKCKNS